MLLRFDVTLKLLFLSLDFVSRERNIFQSKVGLKCLISLQTFSGQEGINSLLVFFGSVIFILFLEKLFLFFYFYKIPFSVSQSIVAHTLIVVYVKFD